MNIENPKIEVKRPVTEKTVKEIKSEIQVKLPKTGM